MKVNRVIHGDCIEVLKEFPTHSVDFVFTDPPYGIGKERIGKDDSLWAFRKPFQELYRVLKPNSFLVTFVSIEKLKATLQAIPKFSYVWQIVCHGKQMNFRSYVGFSKYMSLLVFEKGNAIHNKKIPDVLIQKRKSVISKKHHPTQKNPYWCQRCLPVFTEKEDIVLDPFFGSGSTGVACKRKERNYIGIEIKKKYVEMARRRIKKTKRTKCLEF